MDFTSYFYCLVYFLSPYALLLKKFACTEQEALHNRPKVLGGEYYS